ncbi:MAG: dTDP-4-dehydrorhamnose 3,5-epimerase [Leptospirales bacterium]
MSISDVILIEPTIFSDPRGYFYESFHSRKFSEVIGSEVTFVQDNESYSKRAILRGLHYQIVHPQGKLVRVTQGEIFDVAVDLRHGSSSFGKWVGEKLSSENKKQLWVPQGFAHGFLVLSEFAQVQYKVTDYRYPEHERCIKYDDPDIGIQWPLVPYQYPIALSPVLSEKDGMGARLRTADIFGVIK